eukprot:scaffold147403_cov19-Tisochrysis_lutea.AAC.2
MELASLINQQKIFLLTTTLKLLDQLLELASLLHLSYNVTATCAGGRESNAGAYSESGTYSVSLLLAQDEKAIMLAKKPIPGTMRKSCCARQSHSIWSIHSPRGHTQKGAHAHSEAGALDQEQKPDLTPKMIDCMRPLTDELPLHVQLHLSKVRKSRNQ